MNFHCFRCNSAIITDLYAFINTIKTGKSNWGRLFTPAHLYETFRENEDERRWSFHSLPSVLNIARTRRVYIILGWCMLYYFRKTNWKNPDNQNCIFDSYFRGGGGQMSKFIYYLVGIPEIKHQNIVSMFGAPVTHSHLSRLSILLRIGENHIQNSRCGGDNNAEDYR